MRDGNDYQIRETNNKENYKEKLAQMNKNRRILLVDDEPYNILGLTIVL